jgi:hypothetical protein
MQVVKFSNFEELAPYADRWDSLACGVPFRTWAWMSCWWRHYGPGGDGSSGDRLCVLGVFDDSRRLSGIAPWYLQRHPWKGSILRWLATGEVCSDQLGLLCAPADEELVAECLADYLVGQRGHGGSAESRWDLFEVDGVDARNRAVAELVRRMAERGCAVRERPAVNCWRVELPATWDAYLAMLSRPHRNRLRRLHRVWCETGRAVLHTVERDEELPRAIDILVDLHQRRRNSLGEPGCFASQRYTAFHREAMSLLLAKGQLQLHWLEMDGRPAAAEYFLASDGVTYVYQGGVEPELLAEGPGALVTLILLRRAIERGERAVDFLRGDEPYKQHFRAAAYPCLALHVVPNRPLARLRADLWMAGRNVKRRMTEGLRSLALFSGTRRFAARKGTC